MLEDNKNPQTTHGSEQNEEKYLVLHFKGGLTVKCKNVILHQWFPIRILFRIVRFISVRSIAER